MFKCVMVKRIEYGNMVPETLDNYLEDIQMFLLNMSFISRVKWTIFIFHEWLSHK